MSEPNPRARPNNRGKEGNKGGRPKSTRPLAKPRTLQVYDDQTEWMEEKGGAAYIRKLIDWHKANPVPLYDPKDLIA